MGELKGPAIRLLDAIGYAESDTTPDLAAYVGLSSAHASRLLRDLADGGHLSTSSRVMTTGRGRRGRLVWALTSSGVRVLERYAQALDVVRYTDLEPTDFTVEPNGCWNWAGRPGVGGYCVVNRNGADGAKQMAHRYVFEQLGGDIPDGLELDHLCRNRRCVNIDHLEPVTRIINVRRSALTQIPNEVVAAIREADEPQAVIAARFGIAQATVSKIKLGQRRAGHGLQAILEDR
jgi:DNA-binding MarR family transcriptional regulator